MLSDMEHKSDLVAAFAQLTEWKDIDRFSEDEPKSLYVACVVEAAERRLGPKLGVR
jgi:hypothetical protein